MKTAVLLIIIIAVLESCSGSKQTSLQSAILDSAKTFKSGSSFKYKFYVEAFGLYDRPHDKIWIDTTGQVTFDTDQQLSSGQWKHLRGYAYLEPKDDDTLFSFIKDTSLLYIDEHDVTPDCPKGDQYVFRLWRSDNTKEMGIHANFCATEYNLLTGHTRKMFPKFLAFISRLRDRYRVGVMDPGK